MSEIVTTYLLSDPDQPVPMGREEFYEGQIALFKAGKKPNRAIEIAQILLFTPDKDIILQKRSLTKNHNPGLIDKSVGGHVTFGNTPWYTTTAETLQELHVPSFVLGSQEDFKKTKRLLHTFLNQSAIVWHIDNRTATLPKMFNGELVPIVDKYHFYLGLFGGTVKPVKEEASGIILHNFSTLGTDIKERPEEFTEDLKFFLSKYEAKISDFLTQIG